MGCGPDVYASGSVDPSADDFGQGVDDAWLHLGRGVPVMFRRSEAGGSSGGPGQDRT